MDISEEVNENSTSVESKRSRKNGSDVWIDFESGEGKSKAKCKRCGQLYASNGTTNLRRHMESRCPYRDSDDIGGRRFVEFNEYIFREKVAKAIIRHNYPFKFVEHDGIREVFSYLNLKVQHISQNTSKSDVLKIYEEEKEKLKVVLESVTGRICLTSYLWSSLATNGYMTLTTHYVDNNWMLQRRVLVLRHLQPPHDDQNVREKLISFLQEWGIERKTKLL